MDYDCIVIGGGHAGIEASLATSRLGFSTLLITQNPDTIGALSCNPNIGGLSKGNIVREVDALGGEMGKLIDATMIQYRILNRSRGPAVQSPRAQADKLAYQSLTDRSSYSGRWQSFSLSQLWSVYTSLRFHYCSCTNPAMLEPNNRLNLHQTADCLL